MIRKAALFCIIFCFHFTLSAVALNTTLKPDLLTPTEAQGRFDWLEDCQYDLLLEVWEQMYGPNDSKSNATKINELKALWRDANPRHYLTFADGDHQNPSQWYAGTVDGGTCKTIPLGYQVIGVYKALSTPEMCELESESNDWEYIQNVKIGNFENPSEGYLYADYRSKWVRMTRDTDYDIELTAGYTGDAYVEDWILWIDLNNDGVFNTTNEFFFKGSGSGTVTGTLKIPASATTGAKTARIIMSAVSHALPCRTQQRIQWGEVQDFTIYVE